MYAHSATTAACTLREAHLPRCCKTAHISMKVYQPARRESGPSVILSAWQKTSLLKIDCGSRSRCHMGIVAGCPACHVVTHPQRLLDAAQLRYLDIYISSREIRSASLPVMVGIDVRGRFGPISFSRFTKFHTPDLRRAAQASKLHTTYLLTSANTPLNLQTRRQIGAAIELFTHIISKSLLKLVILASSKHSRAAYFVTRIPFLSLASSYW